MLVNLIITSGATPTTGATWNVGVGSVPPTLDSVTPSSIEQGAGIELIIGGDGIVDGATVAVSGTGAVVNAVQFVPRTQISDAHLLCWLTVAIDATVSTRTLTVTNPDTGADTLNLEVTAAPTLTVDVDFNQPDGTDIATVVPTRGSYVTKDGGWTTDDGALINSTPSGSHALVRWLSAQSDADIEFEFEFPASGNFYMHAGFNTNWLIGFYSVSGKIELLYNESSVGSITADHGFANGETHAGRIWFTGSGDTIHLSLDGVEVTTGGFPATFTDRADKGLGGCGVWTYATADNGTRINYFRARGVAAAESAPIRVAVDNTLGADTATYSYANRNNAGTDGHAYKTYAAALAAVKPGGIIEVRSGTLEELAAGGEHCFTVNHVTVRGYPADVVLGVTMPTLTYDDADRPEESGAGEWGQIVRLTGTSTVRLTGLKIIGTHALGDSVSQDLDINVRNDCTGRVRIWNCWITSPGHAGFKKAVNWGSGSWIFGCRIGGGGFTNRDHSIYDPFGDSLYDLCELYDMTGAGLHVYDAVPNPVRAHALVVRGCANFGLLVSGEDHRLTHCSVIDCEALEGAFEIWGSCDGLFMKNNFAYNPGASKDIWIQSASPGTLVTGTNRKGAAAGGAGLAAYTSATDVTTDDVFSHTPTTMLECRRTGSPTDGEDLAGDSDYLIDPAIAWPTAKVVTGAPPIGAIAN